MSGLIDLLNQPRKNQEDYVEFISLTGQRAAFDFVKADLSLSRVDLNRYEGLCRISGDRWVLMYIPFPGAVPPWIDPESLPDPSADNMSPMMTGDFPVPPAREIDRAQAAYWFQVINECELPEGLAPVAVSGRGDSAEQPTRLDYQWRPSLPPVNPSAAQEPVPAEEVVHTEELLNHEIHSRAENRQVRHVKEPSELAMTAYSLWRVAGRKQADIAEDLSRKLGRPITQGAISRLIKQARGYLEARPSLPESSAKPAKVISMDPSRLDLGARADGRSSRPRQTD